MWGEIAAAGLGIAGNIFNIDAQNRQNKENRLWQSNENAKQRNWTQDMWNKQNEYNDPQNQMNRLKNAGINPHLAYSNGAPMNTSNAPASTSVGSIPAGIAPRMDVNSIMNALLTKAQIENVQADTDQKKANTEGQHLINGKTSIELNRLTEIIDTDLALKRVNTAAGEAGIQLTKENVKKATQEIINLASTDKEINQRISNLIAQKSLTEAETSRVLAGLGLIYAQIINTNASTANYRQQIEESKSRETLNYEQAKTQGTIRSNLEADILNKSEIFKQLVRGNQIGDKWDLSIRENDWKLQNKDLNLKTAQAAEIIKRTMLIDVNISSAELEQTIRALTSPGEVMKGYITPAPSGRKRK